MIAIIWTGKRKLDMCFVVCISTSTWTFCYMYWLGKLWFEKGCVYYITVTETFECASKEHLATTCSVQLSAANWSKTATKPLLWIYAIHLVKGRLLLKWSWRQVDGLILICADLLTITQKKTKSHFQSESCTIISFVIDATHWQSIPGSCHPVYLQLDHFGTHSQYWW